jgi:hypothetical protein
MEGDRLDLSPLDPKMTEERWEWMVERILQGARPELTRRAGRAGLLSTIGEWLWPALSAAVLAGVISGAVLSRLDGGPAEAYASVGVIPALEVPEPVSAWLDEERAPQVSDLVVALEGGSR